MICYPRHYYLEIQSYTNHESQDEDVDDDWDAVVWKHNDPGDTSLSPAALLLRSHWIRRRVSVVWSDTSDTLMTPEQEWRAQMVTANIKTDLIDTNIVSGEQYMLLTRCWLGSNWKYWSSSPPDIQIYLILLLLIIVLWSTDDWYRGAGSPQILENQFKYRKSILEFILNKIYTFI